MPRIEFSNLPDDARLWIFAADRPLAPTERDRVLAATDAFLDQWVAHGAPLTSGRELRYDRFLLIGVDERAAGVSGCSIDALLRGLKHLERDLGVTLLDHGPVLYRENGNIARVGRGRFAELAQRGEVSQDTIVFNNTVSAVGDVRAGRWETPAGSSWHATAFWS